MLQLTSQQEKGLRGLLSALIDQHQAQIPIAPNEASAGFWFGGGNLRQDEHGTIWLSGRYRNFGDSRTGLKAGERGLECTISRSDDGGQSFEKVASWSKADLSRPDRKVLSFEGTALNRLSDGSWELFISSEKEMVYPEDLENFQKPGTGVWTIDRMTGASPAELEPAGLTSILENQELPEYLHVKDPVVYNNAAGDTVLIYCSHPYNWSSSNTGTALRRRGEAQFEVQSWETVSRGPSWDVAATRITSRLPIPQLGCFADVPPYSVYFYDGAESLRAQDENPLAQKRPRGYSCEELGGAFVGPDEAFPALARLSRLEPLFVSPWGTGCSRYVETLVMETGILAIWQQSQPDQSQPLVSHFLPMAEIEKLLAHRGTSYA